MPEQTLQEWLSSRRNMTEEEETFLRSNPRNILSLIQQIHHAQAHGNIPDSSKKLAWLNSLAGQHGVQYTREMFSLSFPDGLGSQ